MKKLLSAAAVTATLALLASPVLADEVVRENRSVDAKVTKVKLDGIVDLVVRQGNTPSSSCRATAASCNALPLPSAATRWKSVPSPSIPAAARCWTDCVPN